MLGTNEVRESQENLCYQRDLMMMMMMILLSTNAIGKKKNLTILLPVMGKY